MIEGLFLGLLTFAGLVLIIIRLPQWIKKQLVKHHLLTDLSGIILTYMFLTGVSSSVMALFASATVGVLTTLGLLLAKNQMTQIH